MTLREARAVSMAASEIVRLAALGMFISGDLEYAIALLLINASKRAAASQQKWRITTHEFLERLSEARERRLKAARDEV